VHGGGRSIVGVTMRLRCQECGRPSRLRCQECGRPSGPEAKGWRLYRFPLQSRGGGLRAPSTTASELGAGTFPRPCPHPSQRSSYGSFAGSEASPLVTSCERRSVHYAPLELLGLPYEELDFAVR
jgi:hypothetical protein